MTFNRGFPFSMAPDSWEETLAQSGNCSGRDCMGQWSRVRGQSPVGWPICRNDGAFAAGPGLKGVLRWDFRRTREAD